MVMDKGLELGQCLYDNLKVRVDVQTRNCGWINGYGYI